MEGNTFNSQISKIFHNFVTYTPELYLQRLQNNDYDKKFMDDNNDHPLMSIVGSIFDSIIGRLPNVKAINNFEIDKYLGEWYEIARYISPFEGKDIVSARAIYERNGDSYTVKNIGYHKDDSEEIIRGTILPTYPGTKIGKLSVSFFPLIYANYWIIILADDYSYSVVSTPDAKFLWILSRDRKLSDSNRSLILDELTKMEYDVNKLYWSV